MRKLSFETPDFDERGVSPVIGVILMVAITVILAAVIASFVLGFGDSVSENVQAGADISEKDDGTAGVTWISEGNADNLNISVEGATNNVELNEVGNTATIIYHTNTTAGTNEIVLSDDVGSTRTVQVTVTAVGSGGSRTVVSQQEVELEKQN